VLRRLQSLPVRLRLTISHLAVLSAILLLFVAGTSFIMYWQLWNQLSRFAVEDIETVEGLLFFQDDGQLLLKQDYHNHPQSRQVLERLLEVRSPAGQVLYRNDRLGNESLGGLPFPGEGINGYSERGLRLGNGQRVLLVSRRHSILNTPVVIRLAYSEEPIWLRIREFLTASVTALPVLLVVAGLLAYHLAKRSLAPLEQMATEAERINAEQLHQRLLVANPRDELGQLAAVINKVLDRLERSFEQLRRFTSDASHELRTPLAAIRSVGEVGLQGNKTTAEYQDTIGSMLEEVNRLTRLVENLLTISRADAGQIQPALSVFNLVPLVEETSGLIDVLAEEKDQTLSVTVPPALQVNGDAALLRQALLNVLHNAVKYSPAGSLILIGASETQNRAEIRISDHGPGIPPDQRAKVFDRFYRTDAARSRDTGGAGLGLAIAQWAVRAQQGEITIEDSDRGATFCIRLPLARQGMNIPIESPE
jgi:heavy metal sensor kinase